MQLSELKSEKGHLASPDQLEDFPDQSERELTEANGKSEKALMESPDSSTGLFSSSKPSKTKKSIKFLLPEAPDVPLASEVKSDGENYKSQASDLRPALLKKDDDGLNATSEDTRPGSHWRHDQKEVFSYPDLTAPASGYRCYQPPSFLTLSSGTASLEDVTSGRCHSVSSSSKI